MYQGRIVDTLDPGEATFERLGLLMGGAHPEESSPDQVAIQAAGAGRATDG
jgi:hypothetical protein